jgi:hypothetical protein
LNNLGLLYFFVKRYSESEKVYQRALGIRIKALGDQDPAVAETMGSYARVLSALHREGEAEQMAAKARAILDRQNGK